MSMRKSGHGISSWLMKMRLKVNSGLLVVHVVNIYFILFFTNVEPWPELKPGQARPRPMHLASAWDLPGHRPTKARPKPWLSGQARPAHH